MRKLKLYMIAAAAAVLSASCLDKYPTDAIPADQAITTVAEANQAVIGIYAAWKSPYLYSGNLTLLPDIQADLVYAVNGYSNIYGDIWRWNIQPTNTDIESVYGALYAVIGRCNFLLESIEKMEPGITEETDYEKLQQYKGEAYFSRALAYSELIKCFCKAYDPNTADRELGVVLVSSYSNAGQMKRASLADSYQFVLADLERAAELLEPEEDNTFQFYDTAYFSYYAVEALYARVYLYMGEWQKAIDSASEVIDSGKFLLSSASQTYSGSETYYSYMWNYDSSTEIIWKVGFTTTSYGGKLGQIFLNYDQTKYAPDYVPGSKMLALYESNDNRYAAFFGQATVQTGNTNFTWPLLTKYKGNQNFIDSYNILFVNMPKVFRLSEQYLIRSEAYCRLEKYSEAGKDLATLRQARYTTYGSATLSKDTWLDEISDERVRELFMEGFRLNDLKRWNRGFKREQQIQTIPGGSTLEIKAGNPDFVWPIPQHELDAPGSEIQPNESNK